MILNNEIKKLLDYIPCRKLKKASKEISCAVKGCDRCKRLFYERFIVANSACVGGCLGGVGGD